MKSDKEAEKRGGFLANFDPQYILAAALIAIAMVGLVGEIARAADEVRPTVSMAYVKGNANETIQIAGHKKDQTGDGQAAGIQIVDTSVANLDVSTLTRPGYGIFRLLNTNGTVWLGVSVSNFIGFAEFDAGDPAVIPLTTGVTYVVRGSTTNLQFKFSVLEY